MADFSKLGRIDEVLEDQFKISNSEQNKKVTKNREILKHLIDVTYFLVNEELAFRGHDESNKSQNKRNYTESLNVLQNYDLLLNKHLKTVCYTACYSF